MKAMILAAGLGTRLGELTRSKPKCLVEVHGKTLLEHAIDRLKDAGVDYVVINTHHYAEQVSAFVRSRSNFGVALHLTHEPELLETGGGLYHAREHFKEENEFFVCNADVYHRLDLLSALHEQQQNAPVATLVVMSRKTKRYLVFDSNQELVGRVDGQGEPVLVRDAPVQNLLAFSGLQIATPRLFEYCSGMPEKFSIIEAYLRASAAGQRVRGHIVDAEKWSDVGTPERLEALGMATPF